MGDTTDRVDATLALAERLLSGVRAEAEQRRTAIGAAVVDTGGNLIAAIRMDGAQLVAVPLAIDKAYTAIACGAPSDAWSESSQPGGADWGLNTALGGRLVVFPGGVPVTLDGRIIAGLGVSGAAATVDKACAEAGLRSVGLTL